MPFGTTAPRCVILARRPVRSQVSPTAMNNSGTVVGYSEFATISQSGLYSEAFLTSGSGIVSLGALPAPIELRLRNQRFNQVVGEYINTEPQSDHAFLYQSCTGCASRPNVSGQCSGWVFLNATGINDAGQISGNALFDGKNTTFLLTPY